MKDKIGLIEKKYSHLLRIAMDLGKTSSILQPEDNSLTFARSSKYLSMLKNTKKNIHVIIPFDIYAESEILPANVDVHLIGKEDDVEYVFTYIHNEVNKNKPPKENVIGKNCVIDETAVMNVDGLKVANCPDGSIISLL